MKNERVDDRLLVGRVKKRKNESDGGRTSTSIAVDKLNNTRTFYLYSHAGHALYSTMAFQKKHPGWPAVLTAFQYAHRTTKISHRYDQ